MVLVDPDEQFTIHADDMFTMAKVLQRYLKVARYTERLKDILEEDKLYLMRGKATGKPALRSVGWTGKVLNIFAA